MQKIIKKREFIFLFLILTFSFFTFAQTPTITTLAPVQTSFCAGGNILVQYETDGDFNFGNFFTAQLSDMWGNFSNPVNIGTVPINTGIIPSTIPANTTFGVNYRVRVVSSNPYVVGSVSPLPPIVISNSAISASIIALPDNKACMGDTVELYANLNESYHWSNGETTQSITVTQSGTYNVTVTNYITGCEVTSDDIEVIIYPLPNLDLGSDTGICDGNVLILDAGSGYENYKWNDGVSNSQEYYVHNSGTYFVEVKDTNNCKNFDTINVVVNLNPDIFIGNDTSFCGNIYYLDAGTGFDYYNWNNGLSYNQVLQVSHAGFYDVIVTDSNSCLGFDTIEVNIMHIPYLSLGNDMTICGTSITLDAGNGFDTYLWNDGACSTQFFTITQSGTYYVLIEDSNNCKVSDTVNITINAVPNLYLGEDIFTGPAQNILLDAGSGHSEYLWSDGSTTQTILLNTTTLGEGIFEYWVSIKAYNNCFNTDTINIIIDFSHSIEKHSNQNNIMVFPNPFSSKAYIKIENFNNDEFGILFYDILGRECHFNYHINESFIELNAGQDRQGHYTFLILKNGQLFEKGRFIVIN